MTALLKANRICKRYGDRFALRDVSISIAAGEFVAVLGPSGSGKTTLLRCLTRLTEPDGGEILLGGKAIHRLHGKDLAAARRDMAVVFQQFNLVRRLTAHENVLAGRLASTPLWRVVVRSFVEADRARADAALAAVGLAEQASQRADTLSGGQQQRVAIARAIVQDARVILGDEPVASLDPENAAAILGLLRQLAHSRGIGVLCTLHQPELAARFADRIVRMEAGVVRQDAQHGCEFAMATHPGGAAATTPG
jgi:phosphonate transport system ATP-binding protein